MRADTLFKIFPVSLVCLALCMSISPAIGQETVKKSPADWMVKNERLKAAHSKYPILQQDFSSGDDITKACLSCHTHSDEDFRKTIHWTWLAEGPDKDTPIGKAGYSVNNFCISTNQMNDKMCLDCHTGWKGTEGQVNCLNCHGTKELNFSETMEDIKNLGSQTDDDSKMMAEDLKNELKTAVQSVGTPERKNCGGCHFKGGGGNGVKHGDLDLSLSDPPRELDVHMSKDGGNFACTRCHTTHMHNIAGRTYTLPASTTRASLLDNDQLPKIMCESCHSATPHKTNAKLNDHTDKVACQTCHIPEFARGGYPTKTWWDWSKAGKLGPEGQKIKTEEYMTIKGEFRWDKNIKPVYRWYNGAFNILTIRDVINPKELVYVNQPKGDINDKDSRIAPFKLFHAKIPYDKKTSKILAPLVSGNDGYWETLDWQKSFDLGMKFMGLEYSGEYDFVETASFFPTTHMVAPKDKALSCVECHSPHGRLESLAGFYMPGAGRTGNVGRIGWLVVLLTFAGVTGHAVLRIVTGKKNGRTS